MKEKICKNKNDKKVNKKIISTTNLKHNLKFLYGHNKKICAMVKADAYGHGIETICKKLFSRVSFFGVANIFEALKAKKAVPHAKILIVGKTENFALAIKNNISVSIDSIIELKQIQKIAKHLKTIANVHIKTDTGMNRLGTKSTKKFKQMLSVLKTCSNVCFEGLFTHFCTADCNDEFFDIQMKNFKKFVKIVPKNFSPIIHVGGSHSILHKLPDFVSMVRIGLFIYGYGNSNLKPILSIKSKIVEIKKIKKGEVVGYQKTFVAPKKMKIAIVSIGYADGILRALSNKGQFYANNVPCKILGNVCMDICMIDISNAKNLKVGKFVTSFKNANEISNLTNTSQYEVLTNFCHLR